jgi:hypothetical protein
MYTHCKTLASWLKSLDMTEAFRLELDAVCLFDDPKLDNVATVHSLHALAAIISKFKGYMPVGFLRQVILEAIPFMVPSTAGDATNLDRDGIMTSGREAF